MIGIGVVAILALAGCSQGASETAISTSAAPVLDCPGARAAMDDYSTALRYLATSIEAGDAMSAVGASDTMTFALDQLEASLPELPESGDSFLDASRAVALQVKESVAQSPEMTGLLGELTSAFADPAFADGGGAIDAYVDDVCPEASPSAS